LTAPEGAPRAVIVTVGDELLSGLTVDGNAAWLGRELAGLGIPVSRRATVGDDDDDIQRAVDTALAQAELVLVTGGLGPTRDDRTRDAVAALFGAALRVDEGLLESLRARFRARGYDKMPESNVTQAQIPEGARVLTNPAGTAPGLALEREGRVAVLLPGVPREMKAIFGGDLKQLLVERFGSRLRPVYRRSLHTTGIPESALAERVEAHLPKDMGPVRVAFLPDLTGVELRLSAVDAATRADAEQWLDQVEHALAPAVQGFRVRTQSGDVVESIAHLLVKRGMRLAVAESCTGGLVAKRLTDRAGASDWFLGGVVAYADKVKLDRLGVDGAVLARHGAVSEEVALQMARGVATSMGAEAGVSITGIAGPTGGTEQKPVGTVWCAVSIDGDAAGRREVFPGDRGQIRERAAQAVLTLLLRRLEARS
jgi:nicotinamide-nucleotide amidase